MIKILYTASDNFNSIVQMERFLHLNKDKYDIKVAAYHKDNTNWSTSALQYLFDHNDNRKVIDNPAVNSYANQIDKFQPDLIISDMEFVSSYVGFTYNIPVWQYSPYLITHAVKTRRNILSNSSQFICKENLTTIKNQARLLILNSKLSLVNTHLADSGYTPPLYDKCEWCRPHSIRSFDDVKPEPGVGAAGDMSCLEHLQFLNKF
jgi:hypothetical protein